MVSKTLEAAIPNLVVAKPWLEQLIKPLTRAAGDPSWALMLHPEGLLCDVFVTHGWTEGIFEFISKVLNSWPSNDATFAYCCMLSKNTRNHKKYIKKKK